ncbi:MAG: ribonuclease Z [Bacteroidales bacterium]|nr:ribonuclease Z [Bacteroidales bacterium]
MSDYQVTILGSGSALSNIQTFHSAQVLKMNSKRFLIDAGEGVQIRLRQYHQKILAINHIFISHLHGDHCLGLPGLISSLGMMGRTAPLFIHAHADLEKVMGEMIRYFCADSPFDINFVSYNPYHAEEIYSDRTISVTTVPLKHRVPTCGFVFREKNKERHLNRALAESYEVPIAFYKNLKNGEDFVTPDGRVIANDRLTTPPSHAHSFAYISDTAYLEKIVPLIENVDCLYHEATYLSTDDDRIRKTQHSSAAQAATIAKMANVGKLIIGHHSSRYNSYMPFIEEAKAIFPNTFSALDGTRIEF